MLSPRRGRSLALISRTRTAPLAALLALELLIGSAARADTAATWDAFPRLLCQGDSITTCKDDGCSSSRSSAIWLFDFGRKQVRYQTLDYAEDILAQRHVEYGYNIPATNALLLSSGRLALFAPERRDALSTIEVPMITFGSGASGNVNKTTFICRVPRG